MDITMETELCLLKTTFKNSASRHEDVDWLHHRCYMGEHKSVQCH